MLEKVLEVVDSCLPKDDAGEFDAEAEKSDVVQDLLAHLAEEMIRMNREKQEEIRSFLAWLAEFIGAKVDDLSNKTKVQAYYEIEFPELLSVLKKNKGKLASKVLKLPDEIDDQIALLQLEAMGVEKDTLTKEQFKYLHSWQEGT